MRSRLSAGTVAVLSVPVMISLCLPRAAAFAPASALASARRWGSSARVHGRGGGAWLKPQAAAAPLLRQAATGGVRMMATDAAEVVEVSTGPVDVQSYEAKSSFVKVMQERGFVHSCTNIAELDKKMSEGVVTAYLGFDATASSLHVGSLLQIMILRHLQKCGHKPIVLLGGGTTKVGDPTGKDASRKMLDDDGIAANIAGIRQPFDKLLTFGDGPTEAKMVNNDEWLSELKYLEFLRDYGPLFTINRMLSFDSVKLRLARENPLTFLEFNYMILQAYDFLELNRRYGCTLQMGGSDQWGNMVNGVELCRRCEKQEVYAMTAPLIATADGKKMGKSEGGAVWLNADMLKPFDYWQFWRNTQDADVTRFLKLFTELPISLIDDLAKLEGSMVNEAKKILADECTKLLHGPEVLPSIHMTAASLFASGGGAMDDLPTIEVSKEEVGEGMPLIDLFVKFGFGSSKSEVRKLIQGGGARLNDEKIEGISATLTLASFDAGKVKLSMGKKKHGLVVLK